MRVHALRKTAFALMLALPLLAGSVWALEVPKHTDLVVDQAGLLAPELRQQLSASLRQFQQQHGPQIQLLVVPSLEGEPIEDYSIRVTDQWKLGDEKRDDGVLFLVALEDRALRIEVGQGLEGTLPDITTGRIIRDTVVPFFREGRYEAGVVAGLQEIAQRLGGQLSGAPVYSAPRSRTRSGGGSFFIPFLLFFFLAPRIFGRRRSRRIYGPGGFGGFGGGGFGGGGFGGFGGGGGGGFSGGGASGRW